MSFINAQNLINVPNRSTGDVTARGYKFSSDIEKDQEYLDQIASELNHFAIREDILAMETEIQLQTPYYSDTEDEVNKCILKSGSCTRMGYIFGDYETDKAYLEELSAIVAHRAVRQDIEDIERRIYEKEVEHGLVEPDEEEYTEETVEPSCVQYEEDEDEAEDEECVEFEEPRNIEELIKRSCSECPYDYETYQRKVRAMFGE